MPTPFRIPGDVVTRLVEAAVLAPSSHNTQPWTFEAAADRLRLFVDGRRWLPVADPSRRELFISLGCALENVLVAAAYLGYRTCVRYFPRGAAADLVAEVQVAPGLAAGSRAGEFHALGMRHTNRRSFDRRPLAAEDLRVLQAVPTGPGVQFHLLTDTVVRRGLERLTERADALQFADPAWRAELGLWVREGVFGTGPFLSSLAGAAVAHLDLGRRTGRRNRRLLRSASGVGVLSAVAADRTHRVITGQVFERLFLAATVRGVRLHPMNEVLQVPEALAAFRALLPEGWGTPQLVFRLGYAPAARHTPRRPAREVLRAVDGAGQAAAP